ELAGMLRASLTVADADPAVLAGAPLAAGLGSVAVTLPVGQAIGANLGSLDPHSLQVESLAAGGRRAEPAILRRPGELIPGRLEAFSAALACFDGHAMHPITRQDNPGQRKTPGDPRIVRGSSWTLCLCQDQRITACAEP